MQLEKRFKKNETYLKKITKKIGVFLLTICIIAMQSVGLHAVGNANVDISITAVKENVLSGEAAAFQLDFKITGSTILYNNAKIEIDIPKNGTLVESVDELELAGVKPVYDASNAKLTYTFPTISTGQAYKKIISVKTPNGTTVNNTKLNIGASFEAENFSKVTDSSSVNVQSSGSISVNKKYVSTEGKTSEPPVQGDIGVWEIAISSSNKQTGQLFVKEGTKIDVRDVIPQGTTYVSDDSGGVLDNGIIKWSFDAPSIVEQENGLGFNKVIKVKLKFNDDTLNGTVVKNKVETDVTYHDGSIVSPTREASVQIGQGKNPIDVPNGQLLTTQHSGPKDAYGTTAGGDSFPTVYDWASLGFNTTIASKSEGATKDFQSYIVDYSIDPNLNLKEVRVAKPWYQVYLNDPNYGPLNRLPKVTVSAKINGAWVDDFLVVDDESEFNVFYSIQQLGYPLGTKIEMLRFDYGNAPAGMYTGHGNYTSFTIDKGYTGVIENVAHWYGVDGNGNAYDWGSTVNSNLNGPRHATVVAPSNADPIVSTSIKFDKSDGNVVIAGDNRVTARFINEMSSIVQIVEPIESYVLLPQGVSIKNTPNVKYREADGSITATGGNYEIVSNNFNNTGRQLIKVAFKDKAINPYSEVAISFDVTISDRAPLPLDMYIYAFSGNDSLLVPDVTEKLITNSALEVDSNDLNSNGNVSEYSVKSGKSYTMIKKGDIQTEKFVKGQLDSDYSKFGHSFPGGNVDYRLVLKNDYKEVVKQMTLIDVLPTINDLGITDNVERESAFDLYMTGPIKISDKWSDKVNISYSESKNPNRDDLIKNVDYPATAYQMQNPSNSEDPNWKNEQEVTDWSKIHSFKIELKEDYTWDFDSDIVVDFNMKAPTSENITNPDVLNKNIAEKSRAAWNSFAYSINDLQVVEPARVGVVLDVEEPIIHKDVEDKASKTLTNKDESFTWEIDAAFGTDAYKWDTVGIKDEINKLLDIESVSVTDQDGKDVKGNGTLTVANNVVEFTLNKQDGSYEYLAGQTYTLKIQSKIKATATAADLAPYIKDGGIPNEATLAVGDGSTILKSEKPVVNPPTEEPIIHKDVEDKASKTLTNKDESFTWEIDAAFGTDAYKWDTVVIKDEINKLLDIESVSVTDQDGKDVKGNGTLTVANNVVEFTLNKQDGSYEYLAGQTYTLKIQSKIKATATAADLAPYIKDGGIPNEATLAVGDGSTILKSEKPVVNPPTEEPIIHKDVEDKASKTLTNKDESFTWEIDAAFGTDAYKWDTVVIKDEINKLLDIESVSVTDQDGKDVKGNGTLTVANNVVEFTLNKQDGSYEYLAGQTYTLKIQSKIKATATAADLAPYIKDGGIPNEATLAVGDGSTILKSEKPVVNPPTEEPIIHKDVEDKASKTLTNKDESFTWEIDAAFGTDAYKWDTVGIKDEINKLLDIESVSVTDQDGKDVKGNGTLTVANNVVEFTLNKQDGSYEYLAGQTYTLKIQSKIKATATAADLAPYIKDGGIPNEATLAVGDGSTILKSEKPVVNPPTEEPIIHKDVEDKASKTLTNKDESFTWEIDAAFGTDAYKWDTVVIKDEINKLLDIESVSVTDQDGKDVKGNGTLTVANNVVEFTLNKQDGSYEYLAGQTYTLKIQSKIKATATAADLAPYIKDGGIPNEATLAVGDGSTILKSEKPVVNPPTTKHEESKPSKDLPDTGDSTNAVGLSSLLLITGSVLLFFNKRRKENQN